jgi:hypothetical protein
LTVEAISSNTYVEVFILGNLSVLDISPTTPLNAAGIRTEPSISLPIPIGDIFAAMLAP